QQAAVGNEVAVRVAPRTRGAGDERVGRAWIRGGRRAGRFVLQLSIEADLHGGLAVAGRVVAHAEPRAQVVPGSIALRRERDVARRRQRRRSGVLLGKAAGEVVVTKPEAGREAPQAPLVLPID